MWSNEPITIELWKSTAGKLKRGGGGMRKRIEGREHEHGSGMARRRGRDVSGGKQKQGGKMMLVVGKVVREKEKGR